MGGLPNGQSLCCQGRPWELRGDGSGTPWWLTAPPIRCPLPRGPRKVRPEVRQLSLGPDSRCLRSRSATSHSFLSPPCLKLLYAAPVSSGWKSNLLHLPVSFPSVPAPFIFIPPPATCHHHVSPNLNYPKEPTVISKKQAILEGKPSPSWLWPSSRLRADTTSSREPLSCSPCKLLPR